MIKSIILLLIITINFNNSFARNSGETEITTEDGIEVFQKEKYYLLKKNVEILSDEFNLEGQLVKIYFEKDLYDIKEIVANSNVVFNSEEYLVKGKGEYLKFNIKKQEILVEGNKSELILDTTKMFSNESIKVDNIDGTFLINGTNSKLISNDIFILGSVINGFFEIVDGKRTVTNLEVEDEKIINIKTTDIDMYSKKAVYNKKKSIIELFESVEIKRGSEIVRGDYGILDTKNKSYKVSSKNSNKVKAIISNSNE